MLQDDVVDMNKVFLEFKERMNDDLSKYRNLSTSLKDDYTDQVKLI